MDRSGVRPAGARSALRTLSRRVALFLATVALVVASLLGGAVPAFAHATLLFASPALDSTVATAPTSLTLFFNEPVTIQASPVKLAGPHSDVVLGTAALSHGRSTLNVPIRGTTSQGVYTVTWQVTSQDGDIVGSSYRFAIGPSAQTLSGGQATVSQGSWQTGVFRGLLFAALALALGEQAARRLLRRIPGALTGPRSWMPWAALVGVGASLGLALLLLGNGSLIAGITHPAFSALASGPGIITLVEMAGFSLAATAALTRRPGWSWLPLAAVIVAEALRAHPGIASPPIGIPLTLLHLAAATLWAGTLVYTLRTALAWRHQPALARAAIVAYARPAVWIFVTVVVTGLGSTLLPEFVKSSETVRV